VSDTHQDEVVDVHEDDYERERREARERAYQDVSLRAVELLANAQRAADEAVAEAQSYARDLEETAREQYRVILQRANEAARSTPGAAPSPEAGSEEDAASGPDAAPAALAAATAAAPSAAEAQQLEYVRTYARVAHSQLRAVLGALNDELDKLADLAQAGDVAAVEVAAGASTDGPEAVAAAPHEPGDGAAADEDGGPDGHDQHEGHHHDGHEGHDHGEHPNDGHHHD
jgi:hypothetical protein